jgi:peptide deformylase
MEGCLSLPDQVFEVNRHFTIEVKGKNVYGKNVHFKAVDLTARVIQHEIDHLNVRLICDTSVPA